MRWCMESASIEQVATIYMKMKVGYLSGQKWGLYTLGMTLRLSPAWVWGRAVSGGDQ